MKDFLTKFLHIAFFLKTKLEILQLLLFFFKKEQLTFCKIFKENLI